MRLKSFFSIVLSLSVLFALTPVATYAEDEDCYHSFYSDYEYTYIDGYYHNEKETCIYCGAVRYEKKEHDYSDFVDEYYDDDYKGTYKKKDGTHHIHYDGSVCECGGKGWEEEKHNFNNDSYKKKNKKYHYHEITCVCGEKKSKLEKHKFTGKYEETLRFATLKKKAKIRRYCDKEGCLAYKIVYKKWNYKDASWEKPYYSKSYWCKHSTVSKYSRKVKIKMDNSIKGAIVKLKIGKKVYTKKLKSSKIKSFRIKIKKPKFNQKVSVKIYYKKKKIGEDYYSTPEVTPGNKVKVGMKKAEVKYIWGSPDSKSSASGGWSYWYYDDGSYVTFKKGKVKYWFNAEG